MRQERHEAICLELDRAGRVEVEALAAAWGVQPITIRRDLDELAAQGLLIRVRGGGIRSERVKLEFSYNDRFQQHLGAKQAIARAAAAMVSPGQTVLLDTGSTTQLVARELAGREGLMIVTNSLAVGHELRGALGLQVVVLGGQARPGGIELVGPFTERLLSEIRADVAFLGADAVDPQSGFYAASPDVARVEELMIRAAGRAVVVAAAEKLRRRAFVRYARFQEVDCWVTSGEIEPAQRRRLRRVVELVEVPADKDAP